MKTTPKDGAKLRRQSGKVDRTPGQDREAIKRKVRILYDLQRLKDQANGRVNKPDHVLVELHEADKVLLEYRAKELARFEHDAELDLLAQLKQNPTYTHILARRPDFLGIGTRMSGAILAEVDIEKATTVSKLWAFAGLGTVIAFYCRRCGARLNTKIQKTTGTYLPGSHPNTKCEFRQKVLPADAIREGRGAPRPIGGQKLPYNAWLRSKLVGVMGPNLLKANSPLRSYYDDYKLRKQSAGWGLSDGHRHNAAIRYMVKMALADIWREWRAIEGLEVRPPYHEEYLDHEHAA